MHVLLFLISLPFVLKKKIELRKEKKLFPFIFLLVPLTMISRSDSYFSSNFVLAALAQAIVGANYFVLKTGNVIHSLYML